VGLCGKPGADGFYFAGTKLVVVGTPPHVSSDCISLISNRIDLGLTSQHSSRTSGASLPERSGVWRVRMLRLFRSINFGVGSGILHSGTRIIGEIRIRSRQCAAVRHRVGLQPLEMAYLPRKCALQQHGITPRIAEEWGGVR
jgi:hypothetical protein